MTNLVIVESPTKAKTISRFLGKDFKVESSYGHMRDLPKGEMGIDIEHDFKPRYVIPKKAQKNVTKLKKLATKFDKIILAPDEDREGEAIAWHLIRALELTDRKPEEIERIAFHEITKEAIENALVNPRKIDMNLVNAQQARRILDRLVGYKLSPFLWKKLMRGLSAGRVQSVALRLIIDREEEIRAFKPQDYWSIHADINKSGDKETFLADLMKINDKAIDKPGITDKKKADKILDDLKAGKWEIETIEKKEKKHHPKPPFTTSTIQQDAWQKLRFSAKKTMMVAQQLYEGIDIKHQGGSTGLITYMRTDSLNIAESALQSAHNYIKESFGGKYLVEAPRRFKTKSKGAQEAHEAIRPTSPAIEPDSIKDDLTGDQYKLYGLIWKRFIATQMTEALFDHTTVNIKASKDKDEYLLQSKGNILKFDGFMKVYQLSVEEKTLPNLEETDSIEAKEIRSEDHQTQPPARYGDASLVKALEAHGVGRPSTYAQIISTITARNYVERNEGKKFVPTEVGEKVNKMLVEHFPDIVDINFTAEMEDNLDKIAHGKVPYPPVIRDFYGPFEKNLEEKMESVQKIDMTEETDEICEKCGKPMIIKYGRFGKFMACSGFPDCKNTKALPAKGLEDMKCPLCKEGDVISRKTKRGRMFYGCSNWPKCQFATWQKPTGKLCPDCKSPLVELKDKIKCSAKDCAYEEEKKDE